MKKIMIIAAIIVAACTVNAASFRWSGVNVYEANGTTKYTGTAELYAVIDSTAVQVSSAAINNGAITATTFESDKFVVGSTYDFYFVITDGDKSFTSASITAAAQANSTSTIAFANQGPATQNAANWTTASVPEPTSGLLLLLGVAGLALRRKQK